MQLSPSKARSLEFPIGDKTYTVPAAGVTAGVRIAELLSASPAQRVKLKITTLQLFKLAVGDVWDEMDADGVPYTEAFRLAMACLAREQTLMTDSGPDRWDNADRAAAAVWESGIDPKEIAEWVAENSPDAGPATKRSTRTAAASTTRSPASGTGTRSRSSKTANRSRGRSSAARGR